MTLEEVKTYLRVDGNDDNTLIQLIMSAAEEFISSAVGSYDETKSRFKLLFCAVVQDMYDNRQMVTDGASSYTVGQQYRNVITSLIRQLQMEELVSDQEPEPDPEEEQDGDGV